MELESEGDEQRQLDSFVGAPAFRRDLAGLLPLDLSAAPSAEEDAREQKALERMCGIVRDFSSGTS